jgi:cytidylate kinase
MKIIINGRAASGKDVVADYLVNKYNFKKVSFAEPIYQIARNYFNMEIKDRDLLQQIGQKMREINPNVWVNYAFKVANQYENAVIADLRQANEYLKSVEYDYFPIRINADLDIRIKRLRDRDGVEPDLSLLENSSETGADNFIYREVSNNGTFEELYKQIDDLVVDLRC